MIASGFHLNREASVCIWAQLLSF